MLSPVAIIGAGALGSALAQRAQQGGLEVAAVLSRRQAAAERLAARVGAAVAATELSALPEAVEVVWCCVPDEALAGVAHDLSLVAHPWADTLVAHTSGVLPADHLAPLAARGAAVLSFHPMQAFAPGAGAEAFDGVVVGLEGAPEAVAQGEGVAAALDLRAVRIPQGAKASYHLAGVMASNFVVTLVGLATEVLQQAGIVPGDQADLLRGLVAGTAENLQAGRPEDVLTGPIVRGDVATVQRHLDALAAMPHLMPIYAVLGVETVRLAVRGRRLGPDAAQDLLDLLHAAVSDAG